MYRSIFERNSNEEIRDLEGENEELYNENLALKSQVEELTRQVEELTQNLRETEIEASLAFERGKTAGIGVAVDVINTGMKTRK